jgi:hypothetical protein
MRRFIGILVAVLVVVGAGVGAYILWWPQPRPKNGPPDGTAEPVVFHSNCLSPEDRKVFYHLAEGSEVFPLDWLRAAKKKGSDRLFLDDMERFGLLPDPDSEEKLPVGLTAAETRGLTRLGKMVGINCAACHVGQIAFKRKSLRIDGAPNLFDGNMFFTELVEAGEGILSSPLELIGFLHRLHAQSTRSSKGSVVSRLLAHLAEEESELQAALLARIDRVLKETRRAPKASWALEPGAGGTDEANRKKLLEGVQVGELPPLVEKASQKDSPLRTEGEDKQKSAVQGTIEEVVVTVRLLEARLKFLKNLAHIGKGKPDWGFGRVDAFGSVRALYFEPDYVPNGPVSYPHIWAFDRNPWFHYDGNTTSVLQRNLGQALGVGAIFEDKTYTSTLRPIDSDRLEQLARKIKVPAWPADFLGPLDQGRIQRGAAHFKKHCVACHGLTRPTETAPDRLDDLKVIGTDVQRATAVTADLPRTGKPFYNDLAVVLDKVTKKALEDSKVPPERQKEFEHGRPVEWRTTRKYAVRPLWGVWATAPYLHNGSVPTLHDLLRPAKERPRTFPLGQRDFDPVKVGYATKVEKPRFTFDVSKVGNANSGHEYGVSLSETERLELIEFLKTL